MKHPAQQPAPSPTPARVDPNDIAIVGIALRFPGAHGANQFWANLRAGVESVQEFTDEELTARGVPARLLRDPNYVKAGPVLDGVDLFDPEFFGFSPKDAAILDPQHRHFLECAWEALEDAAHPPGTFRGPIGVFAGCGMGSYFAFNLLSNPALVDSVGMFLLRHTGNDKDFLTTRVSYCLDLRGPSVNIQTACSTSLVAVHTACQSLIGGECDLALAGGVTIEIPHGVGYLFREGEILSPDGHCRVFDRRSQGTIFGSGVGIVVLRRVEDALRDGDRIYALVKGSAVNNDGAGKVSYLAPSVDGQAAVVAEALAIAGVEADTIEYVETHGTGTAMGEPIEIAALAQAFSRSQSRKAQCGVGSVKANIGHLDTAAGVAGLIKVALALHHGEIPPTPNFESPNPAIAFGDTPFYVVDRLRPWPRGVRPRRAGVTALGVGGTNAHVVIEEAPAPAPAARAGRDWQVLCLSARSKQALDEASQRLAAHLRENPGQELADVAFTLLVGRRGFEQRRALACRDREEAVALLESADSTRVHTHASGSSPASVVFVFPGGGAQHPRMGVDLYESETFFREQIDRGIAELASRTGRDLRPLWLTPSDPRSSAAELERPSLQLPAIFILEHALAQFWMSLGVRPDAMIGHSLGENTAACISGVLSFEDALGLVALRGELFESLPVGGMLSIPLSADELSPWLGRDLDLAAVNSGSVSVVSGPKGAVNDLARRLVEAGVDAHRIPIATGAHSRMVEAILPRFLEHLKGLHFHPPRIPFLSNCTGTWITSEQAMRPEYWVEHLRSTVRFAAGVRTLLVDPTRVFLEVGPGKALSSLVMQQPEAAAVRGVIPSLRHAEEKVSDTAHFLTAFGRLWACGVPVDPTFLWRGKRRRRVSLPSYPFQHRRYWIDPGKPVELAGGASSEPRAVDLLTEGFYRPVWKPRAVDAAPADAPAQTWLVFLDSAGLGELLAERLRARGNSVITVRESDDNRKLAQGEYALAPERGREGYSDLVRDLVATGAMPQRIVHTWMLTPDESYRPGSNFFHRNQERGFYSLFFLAQALGEDGVKGALHVTVFGNGMQALDGEQLAHPSKSTVLGPCKVIPREFPGITCSAVDLPLPVSKTRTNGRTRRTATLKALVDLAEAEVLAPPRSAVALYRNGARYESEFERVTLDSAATNGHAPIRKRGVYLVTGGLGGIGLSIAMNLAREAHARIALVGRSPMPERGDWKAWLERNASDDPTSLRIRAVQAIEEAGAEVYVARADVTDFEAMRKVIDETRRRFGGLNGVVHAAGLLRDAPILAKTQQEIEEVFAPKVHGTLVLDALLRDVDLDFLVLFSSVSTVVAPPGQVDYVAANAFMEAYAQGASGSRRTRIVSVSWGIWSEVGMAANALQVEAAPLTPARGRKPRHPLFDSRASDPDAPLLLTARYTPEAHWILDEHRTREGLAVVPGTAYLELARGALLEADERDNFEVRDLLLLRPLHVADGESRVVQVGLRPDSEGYVFSVRSRAGVPGAGGNGSWETHAEARLRMRAPRPPSPVPFAEIEARCTRQRSAAGRRSLPSKQAELVRFGPRWQTLREVRTGPGEVLATLELRRDFASDLDAFGLHPALLDIAISSGLELPELDEGPRPANALWVPVSYKAVRVYAPLTARVRSWVRSKPANKTGGDVLLFDVVVVDEDGHVCVEIEEYAMRRVTSGLDLFAAPETVAPRASALDAHAPRTISHAAQSFSPVRSALQHNFERGIRPHEGMQALQRILAAPGLSRVVATTLDLEDLRRQAETVGTLPHGSQPRLARPALDTEFVEPPDGIERTLAGFWQELLGVRSVGMRDSFFDLGGHSLIAVRLFARIKSTYDVEFPISLLFEAPTIERCAQEIRRATKVVEMTKAGFVKPQEGRYRHLVPLHAGQGGSKTPFFLVAGMFGNVLNLRHLAHLLGSERRFFGLQALGLYGTQPPHETFEEMAADYLTEVRGIQRNGPYLLGGFSGGGITAFEMAHQLLAAGEEVALLMMLDSPLPRWPDLTARDRMLIHWQNVRRHGPGYMAQWAGDKLRYNLAQYQKRRRARQGALPSEFRSEEIGAAFMRAAASYQIRPYPGVITLFRPKLAIAHVLGPNRQTNARREFLYHDNGWGPHAASVEVHEVLGDHDSMILEPNVRALVARLRKCIEKAEASSPRFARMEGRHVTVG